MRDTPGTMVPMFHLNTEKGARLMLATWTGFSEMNRLLDQLVGDVTDVMGKPLGGTLAARTFTPPFDVRRSSPLPLHRSPPSSALIPPFTVTPRNTPPLIRLSVIG